MLFPPVRARVLVSIKDDTSEAPKPRPAVSGVKAGTAGCGQGAAKLGFWRRFIVSPKHAPYRLDQAPPIALITFPLPPQFGHWVTPMRPLPPHSRQVASPVPGVPGGASSPGLSRTA